MTGEINKYALRGTPDADSKGRRLIPALELMQRMNNNPEFREAVRLAGKAEGQPKAATVLFRKQLSHHRPSDMHRNESDLAIELQKRKLAGKLDSEFDVHQAAKDELFEKHKRGEKLTKAVIYSIADNIISKHGSVE